MKELCSLAGWAGTWLSFPLLTGAIGERSLAEQSLPTALGPWLELR